MNDNQGLKEQMWDLVYGLLEPDEVAALHARIKSDPAAARLYAEVRLESDLVRTAAKVEEPTVILSVSAEGEKVRRAAKKSAPTRQPVARRSSSGGMNWLAGMSAAALAVLIAYGIFTRPPDRQLAQNYLVTDVQTPAPLTAGLTGRVVIRTRDANDNPRPAEVYVSLVDREGREQLSRELATNESGAAEVELPGDSLRPGVRLEVSAERSERTVALSNAEPVGRQKVVAPLSVQPEPVATYRLFDKPHYAPGEPVQYFDISLSRFSRHIVDPASSLRRAAGQDFSGLSASSRAKSLERDAADAESDFQPAAPQGASGRRTEPEESPPSGPDDESATKPRPDALARLDRSRMVAPGSPAADATALANGPSIPMPAKSEPAAEPLDRASPATKGAAAETGPRDPSLADRRDPPAIDAIRYGGSAGKPVSGARADHLQAAAADDPANRQEFPRVAAGQPLEMDVPAEYADRKLLLAAVCDGVVVAGELFGPAQPSVPLRLPLPGELAGEFSAQLYDAATQPPALLSKQVMFREPLQKWDVSIAALKAAYKPGERVRLAIEIKDETGQAAQSALGVRVWKEDLAQATVGRTESEPLGMYNSAVPLLEGAPAPRAEESAYRFREDKQAAYSRKNSGKVAQNENKFIEENFGGRPQRESALAGEGAEADVPAAALPEIVATEVASNRAAVLAAYREAVAADERATESRYAALGQICLLAGIAALVFIGLQVVLRLRAEWKVLVPAIAMAAASLLAGAIWIRPAAMLDNYFTRETADTATPEVHVAKVEAIVPPSSGPATNEIEANRLAQSGQAEPATATTAETPAETASPAVVATPASPANAGMGAPPRPAESAPATSGDAPPPVAAPTAQFPADKPARDPTRENKNDAASGDLDAAPASGKALAFKALDKKEAESSVTAATPAPSPANAPPGEPADAGKDKPGGKVRGGTESAREMERREGRFADGQKASPQTAAELGGPSELKKGNAESESAAPSSLYWNPQLTTDANGRVIVEFTMPDVDSDYRILVDAYGNGRLGSHQAVIACRADDDR